MISFLKPIFLVQLVFSLIILSTNTEAQLNVEPKSGFYSDSITVTVESSGLNSSIYFTLDGSVPDTTDQAWTNDLIISTTTSLRVVEFSSGFAGVDTQYVTRSYLMNEDTELPVLTIATDPDNFFSDETGIYVEGTNGIPGYCRSTPRNWNQDWERPVALEFFEKNRNEGFSINAGVKIGGGCTRLYDQKSLDIYFRGEYGTSRLEYKLFEDKNITEFNRLSLRNGGQDWYRAMVRNAFIQSSLRNNMDLGYQAFKPVVVFLNGEYWGIHMLREKQNEDFLESNYGYKAEEIDILKNRFTVNEGSNDHYVAMLDFIEENDLTISENYEWVSKQMDIEQYIDYQIAQIYIANGDWPGGNIRFWRPQQPDAKWRWIMYDVDMSMNSHGRGTADYNSLVAATTSSSEYYNNPPWSTFLLRSLLKNEEFKNKFIQRSSIHMQFTFEPTRLEAFLDSTTSLIESEVPRHMDRWKKSFRLGKSNWEQHVELIRSFIYERPENNRWDLYYYFDLIRLNKLQTNVEPAGAGLVRVEDFRTDTTNGVLLYNSIPSDISAHANPGYEFVGWSGVLDHSTNDSTITITSNTSVTAHFKRKDITETSIVINEINYRSSDTFNPQDWVEFYNNSSSAIDISGWYFSDSDDTHKFIFANGTVLASNQYLVLTRDSTLFKGLFPDVKNRVGDMDFGLSGDGELVRLFDSSGNIIDELTYNDKLPWPVEADGGGATIALTNPGFDNSDGSNWAASFNGGTPGRSNADVLVSNEEDDLVSLPKSIQLYQNYPNPFNPTTTIKFALNKPADVSINVYNIQGQLVAKVLNERKSTGEFTVNFNAETLASGVYFYRLSALGQTITKKFTIIK